MVKLSIPGKAYFNPTLRALHNLGGSGTIREIHDEAVVILGLSEEQIQILHNPGNSNQTEVSYRLAWARTWMKRYGLLENKARGVWELTIAGKQTREVDPDELERSVKEMVKAEKHISQQQVDGKTNDGELSTDIDVENNLWREDLYHELMNIEPDAFERLVQLILRRSGFDEVEVTGQVGDGGIDGKGILKINDFLTFRIVFQCKRYKDTVGPDVVQKLRGAMPSNVDRGLVVTTGRFTQGAVKEAMREDRHPVELIDGEMLVDKLKELSLGVKLQEVQVDPDFFANI
jgi:restriction system protein